MVYLPLNLRRSTMEFMTIHQLNEKLITLTRNERKLTGEILNHIILFQKCGGYLKLGYSSMHEYLTRALGYSDDQAYRRLKAARLMQDVPDVADQLKEGVLNLSQAAAIQKAIETSLKETGKKVSEVKKKEIIKAVEKASNFNTKAIVANSLNLKPKENERATPQSNDTVRLEINLTKEQFDKLQTIKSLLSHQIPDQNSGKILEVLFDQYLNKNTFTKSNIMTKSFMDCQIHAENNSAASTRDIKIKNAIHKRYISVEVKKALFKKAQGCCEYVNENVVRCRSRYKLQVDHYLKPFSQGGDHSLKNLRIHCSAHNAFRASQAGIGYESTTNIIYTGKT